MNSGAARCTSARARVIASKGPYLKNAADHEHSRIEGVDAIRIFAALGAAFLHTAESPELHQAAELGRFAVPVFNTLAAYFLVRSLRRNPRKAYGPYVTQRAIKLYLPFLAWNLVYIGARWIKAAVSGGTPPDLRPGQIFLEGASHQLWYLPFAIVCSLVAFPLARWAVGNKGRSIFLAAIAVGGATWLAMTKQPDWWTYPSIEYLCNRVWNRTPSYLFGFAIALMVWRDSAWEIVSVPKGHLRKVIAAAFFAAGCACMGVGVFTAWGFDHRSAMNTLAGLLFVASAFGGWSNVVSSILSRGYHYAFGIFLTHTLFIEGAQTLLHRAGFAPAVYFDLAVYLFAIVGSVLLTMLIRMSKKTTWLIP